MGAGREQQLRSVADAIVQDILTRKGLGSAWRDWWNMASEHTREAVLDAWVKLMADGIKES